MAAIKVQGTEGQENQPKPAHLSPEQPIGPEMDRWTMKDQEDQQDEPKPARPSTAKISPEMDRWTMKDQEDQQDQPKPAQPGPAQPRSAQRWTDGPWRTKEDQEAQPRPLC